MSSLARQALARRHSLVVPRAPFHQLLPGVEPHFLVRPQVPLCHLVPGVAILAPLPSVDVSSSRGHLKLLIRQQHSSGSASMQQAATASSPPTPTPEEYVRSVKAAIARVKTVEEDVSLQYMFFWVLSGFLFTTAFIVPDKLKKMKGKNELAMESLEANKKMLKENQSSLDRLKKNHSDLEEELRMIRALMPPPAPASQAAPISPPSSPLNSAPVAADET
ncbi:unnamed protein product [Urochloa humidicola]